MSSLDRKVKVAIGIALFNQDRESFEDLIDSVCNSIKTIEGHSEFEVQILLKWNSVKTFDPESFLNEKAIDNRVIEYNSNTGFGSAHNSMMEASFNSDADFYLCLNPDGLLHPECITKLLQFSINLDKPSLIEAIQFPREHPKPYDPFTGITQWCSGACLLISKEVYSRIGGFDDNLFMYCEDIDYSWRIRSAGIECYTCTNALFFHDVSESKSPLIKKLMLESARYIAFKWSAPDFQMEMERQLIENRFYPAKEYLPEIKRPNTRYASTHIQEWRQLLSFSIPRW